MRFSQLKILLFILFLSIGTFSCAQNKDDQKKENVQLIETTMTGDKISKSEEEWKATLTAEEFNVLREQGTERAFSSPLNENKEEGIYVCAACGNPLFSSETKFKSGTGWPSFYAPISEENVGTKDDRSFGMVRSEVHCARCGGHLGHIFEDGPEPTGLRYCLNGVALDFKKEE